MSARILVIEDNPANLELVRYLLQWADHEVLSAVDGAQGLALAQREEGLDLVICDLQMPVLDGYEVLARLRDDPATRALRVIAVTAFSMAGDQRKVMEAGFDGYLSKPIDPETFVATIQTFMARGC